jgi:hypothetical protein
LGPPGRAWWCPSGRAASQYSPQLTYKCVRAQTAGVSATSASGPGDSTPANGSGPSNVANPPATPRTAVQSTPTGARAPPSQFLSGTVPLGGWYEPSKAGSQASGGPLTLPASLGGKMNRIQPINISRICPERPFFDRNISKTRLTLVMAQIVDS